MPIAKSSIADAVVLGGGIVGLSCAIALQRRGVTTTVIAATPFAGSASWGNAGHIAVEQVEPLASLATIRGLPRTLFWRGGALSLPPREIATWLPFSLRLLAAARPARFAAGQAALTALTSAALPAWRRLLALSQASHLLVEQGHMVLWESPASAGRGREAWRHRSLGSAGVRDATSDELDSIQRLVAPRIAGGVRFTGSGQIADPDALGETLEQCFAALGGEVRRETVRSLDRSRDGAVLATLATGEKLSADAVILATGAASGGLLASLGCAVPLIAERGYHIQAETSWPDDVPPTVFEDRSMIVTRFRHRLRAASFVEFGSIATPPDARKWQRLEEHAKALGLPFTSPPERWMGARPTLPDYLPAIGRHADLPNLFYAFGHQHLGLTLGPLTGELIGAMVTGDPVPLDITPFDVRRFG
jgi:D-hydroxyproline dehydrogenase